mmetsp:Transcript_16326/g.33115  ORF Transcript_16326/g.33115 Transcript_16326/m.33115 type:complete len:576 (-) Transcript_16326:245-1972(-)
MNAVTMSSICSKGFCGGIIEDLKRRAPWYLDDWTDIFYAKVLASIFFMFFTSLAPAITFSVLLEDNTDEDGSIQIGAVEVILSTAVTGSIFAIFAGQPLCIVGVTGPVSIFTIAVFNIGQSLGVKFLPFYAWTQIWAAIMHIVLAMTNMCDLIAWVTRYSCETFGCLIAIIYLFTGSRSLGEYFYHDMEAALLSMLLGAGTCLTALFLAGAREWKILNKPIRDTIADYAATVSILFFSAVPYMTSKVRRVNIEKLQVPDTFETTSGRSWLVDLGDIHPGAAVGAIIPGFILTVLFFFDHNVSSLLAQSKEFKLKKGSAYHWDFFIIGINILITGLLGIPPVNGLIPQAPLHTKSLAEVEFEGEGSKKKEVVKLVHEQRVSNLLQAVLIGIMLSPPLLEVLGLIPRPTLDGLFLFMGFASFGGNQFAERVVLLITEPELRDSHNDYLEKVPWETIRSFTWIQMLFCAVIFALTLTPAAMIFPLLIASLVVMRKVVFPRFYQKEHLLALDDDGMEVGEEEGEKDDGDADTSDKKQLASPGAVDRENGETKERIKIADLPKGKATGSIAGSIVTNDGL